ncbi:peptidoglycan-recognition protein LF-like isoform X4 [Wyeomyia smithii]|uniref:peptidoglycan-recognition protein LF-like isoform X4 n=1 Tax=Wyeomyia smithii TaxID=174621 RepID=UPI002467D523|nr:peptidoglycan-recognition protein LF-like isoform X4 [Wyeomyia smithii]
MAKSKNGLNSTPSALNSNTPYPSTSQAAIAGNYPVNSGNSAVEVNSGVDKSDSNSSPNISISSINENDNNDSSAFESSDSECDDEQIKKAIERIPNSLQPGGQLVQNGMLTVTNDNDSPSANRGPNIGSIAVQNSSDITFGNKTYIKGQVVIKNIYRDRQDGVANQGFQGDTGANAELETANQKTSELLNPKEPLPWRSSLKAIIRDKPLLCVAILIGVMLAITVIVISAYVATTTDKDFLPDPKPLRIVTRNEWLAQPPREDLEKLQLPVHKVIIAHTATEGCTTQSLCVFMTSKIQQFHMAEDSKNYSDIAYNFLVGGDGNAYEGRGWDKQGAHTKGFNRDSICIAFIGTFIDIEPPITQLSAAKQLIALGLDLKKLDVEYRLFGHRQLAPFESPGRKLYKIIQKWPHWSNELGPSHWTE